MTYEIATPLSQDVLQLRRRRGELTPQSADLSSLQTYALLPVRPIRGLRREVDEAELTAEVGDGVRGVRHGE